MQDQQESQPPSPVSNRLLDKCLAVCGVNQPAEPMTCKNLANDSKTHLSLSININLGGTVDASKGLSRQVQLERACPHRHRWACGPHQKMAGLATKHATATCFCENTVMIISSQILQLPLGASGHCQVSQIACQGLKGRLASPSSTLAISLTRKHKI